MTNEDHSLPPSAAVRADPAVLRFASNPAGRDFVVGDVHGMFEHLRRLLAGIGFDPARDRLFSVGDLVDRGPGSREAGWWLDQPWFAACRGNHEQFALDAADPEQLELWVRYNGGEWWLAVPPEEQARLRERFLAMPLALEVETASGLVGVVHADVPPFLTWSQYLELLEAGNREAILYAMWSRNRVSRACSTEAVPGVDRVYCGHTPTRASVRIDNVHYIDTGAAYVFDGYRNARLTLVEIHPRAHVEHVIPTTEAESHADL